MVVVVRRVPKDARTGGRLDVAGTITATAGLTTVVYGLTLSGRSEGADLVTEFPSIDDRLIGLPNRHSYALSLPGSGRENYGIVKFDNKTGERQVYDAGSGRMPGEPVFVPAQYGTEDDAGYLLSFVSDLRTDSSELLILDAGDVCGTPVAVVELPRRVPGGIHGSWIPDANLN